MNTAIEIQAEIEALPHQEYIKLISWLSERDWKMWDQEIEEDSKSGKLDFLISEALEEKSSRKLKEI